MVHGVCENASHVTPWHSTRLEICNAKDARCDCDHLSSNLELGEMEVLAAGLEVRDNFFVRVAAGNPENNKF